MLRALDDGATVELHGIQTDFKMTDFSRVHEIGGSNGFSHRATLTCKICGWKIGMKVREPCGGGDEYQTSIYREDDTKLQFHFNNCKKEKETE